MPISHVYTRHIRVPFDGVEHIGVAGDSRAAAAILSDAWVTRHHHAIDVFHLHFGFTRTRSRDLTRWLQSLSDHAIPLVFTIHDLSNPHEESQEGHRARLELLWPHAAILLTLTEPAADLIEASTGRRPIIVPHPHVAPLNVIAHGRTTGLDKFTVGVHLKSMRPGVDPEAIVNTLTAMTRRFEWLNLRIDVNRDAVAPRAPRRSAVEALLRSVVDVERVEVSVHQRFTDTQLWSYLRSVEAVILPYSAGTHSGWAEACYDLGVRVIAPSHSCIPDQHVEFLGFECFSEPSLEAAVISAYQDARIRPPTEAFRSLQRIDIAGTHREVYLKALGK